MRFFLDTNVFYNHWFLDSAPFKFLFHLLNTGDHKLLLSRLVIQEVENKQHAETSSTRQRLEKEMANFHKHAGYKLDKIPTDAELVEQSGKYDLHDQFRNHTSAIEVIEYYSIPHSAVVERAIRVRKPFQEGEKGYRDTLIWLSLLAYLKASPDNSDVVFITENSTDFFKPEKETAFHDALKEDLGTLFQRIKVKPFRSLAAFVSSRSEKLTTDVDLARFEEVFVTYLEIQTHITIGEFDWVVGNELIWYLRPIGDFLEFNSIFADLRGPIEHFKVLSTKDLSDSECFVYVSYEATSVNLEVIIQRDAFLSNKHLIERHPNIYDYDFEGSAAVLRILANAKIVCSFTYNLETEKCSGFSLDSLDFAPT